MQKELGREFNWYIEASSVKPNITMSEIFFMLFLKTEVKKHANDSIKVISFIRNKSRGSMLVNSK